MTRKELVERMAKKAYEQAGFFPHSWISLPTDTQYGMILSMEYALQVVLDAIEAGEVVAIYSDRDEEGMKTVCIGIKPEFRGGK